MNRVAAILMALLAVALARTRAAVVYSGLQNLGIPTDSAGTGIYLDLDAILTGTDDNSPPPGWDINPFYGGVGVANSPAFQPVRNGAGNMAPILGLAVGAQVDVTRLFSSGYGGSDSHLGTQFTAGQEGYLGFKFTTNAGTIPYYGWMRVVFTGNTAGAVIKDWAYENTGAAILTARVVQSAAMANAQIVTLSPGIGETFTLGSALTNTGGNINSLVKTGLGTTILATASSYTGGTTISGGVLRVFADSALGALAGGVTISNGSTLQAGGKVSSGRAFTLGTGGGKIDTNGQIVTLTAVTGSALTKLGSGTLILNGPQTYNSLTASAGTTSINGVLGTAPGLAVVSVSAGATAKFGTVSQTLGSLTIGAGATVAFTSGPHNFTKNDSTTQTLGGFLNYATLTTNAGVLNVNGVIGDGTCTVAVNNPGTRLNFGSVSQTLASLTIGAGATVTFTSGPQHFTKNDGSTQSLSGFLNYASVTTNAGVLNVNGTVGNGISTVAVNNPGTKLKFGSVSQTLASLSIGAGATVIFTSGVASGSLSGEGDGRALGFVGDLGRGATVPEPGTLGLLLIGALGVLGRRRKPIT
jgi:autotransporter-associated beta strand protein